MSALLAIESSTDVCSVCVGLADEVFASRIITEGRRHAEMLVPLIDTVLSAGGVSARELSAIAVSAGPGSYTGLRIGVSTAKGIAAALGTPLVAVPTLSTFAEAARDRFTGNFACVMRARRNQFYVAHVRDDSAGSGSHPSPAAIDSADLAAAIADSEGLAGPAAADVGELLQGSRHVFQVSADAQWVLRVGTRMWRRGELVDAEQFEPYYIQPFVARTPTRSAFDRLAF